MVSAFVMPFIFGFLSRA
ncbi:hypothetical protein FZC70_12525 [Bacillus subtilis]|nr:hypothetical protein FZC70_12525 [Bacillus subtilis]